MWICGSRRYKLNKFYGSVRLSIHLASKAEIPQLLKINVLWSFKLEKVAWQIASIIHPKCDCFDLG